MEEILVIDDNAGIRSLVTNILDMAGYRTREASDGDAGLRLCRARRPALVITDILMPEKEGLELIRELSREMPDIAIVAMSGTENSAIYLRAAGLFGAVAVLSKPFSPDELLCAVEAALQRSTDPAEREAAGPAEAPTLLITARNTRRSAF
jgi:DNA-binding response OmpR family regulator